MKSIYKIVGSIFLSAIILYSTAPVLASVINPKDWSTVSSVSESGQGWFFGELPNGVIKNSAFPSTLSDIRLVDEANTEIPYVVVRQGSLANAANPEGVDMVRGVGVKILENTLERGPQGQDRVMVLEIPVEGKVYNGIELQIAAQSKNFRKVVRVAVSDVSLGASSPAWREIESKPVIYNYSDPQGLSIQKSRVDFTSATSRYIRLRFEQDPSLVGSGAQFTNNVIVESASLIYESDVVNPGATIKNYLAGAWVETTPAYETVSVESSVENVETKATEVIYTSNNPIGFVGATSLALRINEDESNFKRQVTVLSGVSENGSMRWQRIASGQIYRIQSPVFKGELLKINFNPTTASHIKVIIQNNNDRALKVSADGVVGMQKIGVLFKKDTASAKGIKLLVGNSHTVAPTYEIEKTISYFQDITPEKVTIGEVEANPLFKVVTADVPFDQKYTWLLNGVLIVFVLLIALLGWKYRAHKPDNTDPNIMHEN